MATYAETLALYEAARDEVITNGFSVAADGQTWTRDNLTALERLIDKYRALVNRQSSGNVFQRSPFGVPRRDY